MIDFIVVVVSKDGVKLDVIIFVGIILKDVNGDVVVGGVVKLNVLVVDLSVSGIGFIIFDGLNENSIIEVKELFGVINIIMIVGEIKVK